MATALTPPVTLVVTVLTVLFLLYWLSLSRPRSHRRRRSPAPCALRRRPEYFASEEPAAVAAPVPNKRTMLRDTLDFSDVHITDTQRRELAQVEADTDQIQSVNDRFQAAKRTVTENKLKIGVLSQKQRRKVVETLLRRPHCGRRVRSWRTENSDFLRGDVRPKVVGQSTNIMRSAKSSADRDLHPGALGPMAGLAGKWLSEEGGGGLPGNLVPEALVYG